MRTADMRPVFAAIHNRVSGLGYKDIELDFSGITATFAPPMLAVASQCQTYLKHGVDTFLILPKDEKLKRLFINTNWANLIDPRSQPESSFGGHVQIPAMKYSNDAEQYKVVSKILDVILGSLAEFDRSHLRAIEWSINEITDNVINHSESEIGGLVQVTSFSKNRKAIEFVVCDGGVGIPSTLRSGHPELKDDTEALDRAIREGVTPSSWHGQGNGLFGTYRVAELTGGNFEIQSGCASLFYTPKSGLRIRHSAIPFNGTLVAATIRYEESLALEDALKFNGKSHTPTDYIELSFGEDEKGNVKFILRDESEGFGSRASGEKTRNKLMNLVKMTQGRVTIDFSDVPLVSSSYADEVFGKMFSEIGPITFSIRFEFSRIDGTVKRLIDRAISQRMKL